jgi:bile acid:Na+ symporter, BASS family
MTAIPPALMLVIQSSIIALGLALGLDAGVDDVLYLTTRPARLGRAFLAICIVVPAAAAVLVQLLPLIGPVKAGIVLMALAPMPPVIPPRSLRLGARRAYVYGLYVTFVVLTVVTVPVTVQVLSRIFHVHAHVPIPRLVRDLLVTVIAPIAVGMFVRALWPDAAHRLGTHIDRISKILLMSLVALVIALASRQLVALIGNGTLLAMLGVVVIGVVCGHLLGGPDRDERAPLASASGMRHPGIALMIAQVNFPDKRVDAAIVLFTLVGLVVITLYYWLLQRRRARPSLHIVR